MTVTKNETGRRLWLTADKRAVVGDGSPSAAFLLVGVGGVVPPDFEDLYRSHVEAPASRADRPELEKSGARPAPKHQPKRASKKASAASFVAAGAWRALWRPGTDDGTR